jgi:hypothetical protein
MRMKGEGASISCVDAIFAGRSEAQHPGVLGKVACATPGSNEALGLDCLRSGAQLSVVTN